MSWRRGKQAAISSTNRLLAGCENLKRPALLHRQNLVMTSTPMAQMQVCNHLMDPFSIHHLQSHYGYWWSYCNVCHRGEDRKKILAYMNYEYEQDAAHCSHRFSMCCHALQVETHDPSMHGPTLVMGIYLFTRRWRLHNGRKW